MRPPLQVLRKSASSLGRLAGVVGIIVLALGLLVADASAESKRVLMLNSFGRDFRPWSEYAKAIRIELERRSPWYVDIQDYPLVSARSPDDDPEDVFVEYMRALYRKHPPDLIIAVGAPAALFVRRWRSQLFPTIPMLLTAVDGRFALQSAHTANDAVVAVKIDVPPLFDNILRLLPETKTVVVTLGASPVERLWRTEMEKSLKPFENRIDVIYCNDMSFEELLRLAEAPPPHTAILWTPLRVDAAGVTHEGDLPLKRLYAATKAPIFSYDDVFLNGEIVGGPMLPTADVVNEATTAAIGMLSGQKASDIRVSPIGYAAPKYDWRQLQRWKIHTNLLPPGSSILFRQQSAFERYRWQIILFAAVLLLQASLITGLLYERRLRHAAETEAQQRMSELAHINRQATAGELSSSITHELNQPLGAILANADTAELMLNAQSPDLMEIRQIIADIRRDDERASAIISHLRSLLKKAPLEFKQLDLGEIIREVIEILERMANTRKIAILYVPPATAIAIQGDAIHLQQVLMNLIVNSMDAISDAGCVKREVMIRIAPAGRFAEVSISDSGPGIATDKIQRIFDPFFTTKQHGMGMGLSIVRTIVRAHNGRVSVDSQSTGGAVFRIHLPIVSLQ
jgi:signal transduction histidine kinase